MKAHWAMRPLIGTVVMVLGLAGFSASSPAAPPMSVDAQALAHWGHFTRLSLNSRHVDAPFIVVDREQLRWWLIDPKGRWTAFGPAVLGPAGPHGNGRMPPLLPAPPAPRTPGDRDGG